MKKILLVLLTFGMLCGCQGKKEDTSVKIGVILPLTGDLAFLGNFMKNSILLNDSLNSELFIFEDCGGDPKQAVLATNKLINTDKVSALISSVSYLSESINPLLKSKGIPHFILSFSPRLWKEDNVIQPFVSTDQEAEMFVKYIAEHGISSVAFLRHQEPDATYGYDNYVKPRLDSMNVSITDIVFDNKTVRDFKNDILKIKSSNVQLLIIQSLAYNIPNIISAINTYDLRVPVLGDLNFLDIPDANTRSLVEGIPFIGVEYLVSENYKLYQTRYLERYNTLAFALGSFAYDLSILLDDSFMIFQDKSQQEIITHLNNLGRNNKRTISDNVYFGADGQLVVQYCLMKYQNGMIQMCE